MLLKAILIFGFLALCHDATSMLAEYGNLLGFRFSRRDAMRLITTCYAWYSDSFISFPGRTWTNGHAIRKTLFLAHLYKSRTLGQEHILQINFAHINS